MRNILSANFTNVSRLNIARDDGWFVMDDFTVQSAVPEPGSVMMYGCVLGLLAALARSRRRRSPR